MKTKTPDSWVAFTKRWEKCTACPIGKQAYLHVFGDGFIPAKFMFIGEGPGVSEDALGLPFIGPSGRLLRKALVKAGFKSGEWFFTNLVACRPADHEGHNRAPESVEVDNCMQRLRETVDLVRPRIIVTVGKVAQQYLLDRGEISSARTVFVWHPSFILRNGGEAATEYPNWIKRLTEIRRLLK